MLSKGIAFLTKYRLLWPLVALLLVLGYSAVFTPGFFTITIKEGRLFGSLIDILKYTSPLIIMSVGMTLVIATEGIDLSIGAIVAIAASIACSMIAMGESYLVAIFVALAASIACGFWNGVLVAKMGIQPMIGTLILMTVGRGIAQLITQGQIITVNHEGYSFIGNGYLFGLPFAVYCAFVVVMAIHFLLRATPFGLFIESVGANRESSRFTGIKASNITLWAYVLCGLFAGVAGIFISSNVTAADANNAGLWKEIDAILATVIGGTAMTGGRIYLFGTVIGALFIQTLTTTIYSTGVAPEIILVVKAFVVLAVTLLQSAEFRAQIGKTMKKLGVAKA